MSEPIAATAVPSASHRSESPPERAAQRTAAPASSASGVAEPVAIPRGGVFNGLLSFSGEACVLGALSGRVRARGKLRVGCDARVDAQIEADEVVIEGWVRGDVVARGRLELGPTSVVEGAIHSPRVELHEGCRFTGRCESGDVTETLGLPS